MTRRGVVVAGTLVVGTTLLGLSLATAPGSSTFYPLTLAVALVWVAGGLASGPVPLGPVRADPRRTVVIPIGIGIGAAAAFAAGAAVIREIGPLRTMVADVLAHARQGDFVLVYLLALVTGAAEEVFFRGALFAAVDRRRAIPVTVAVYTLVTIATGNAILVAAALVMGAVWALERRATGGVVAPMVTHVVWSAGVLLVLPPIINR